MNTTAIGRQAEELTANYLTQNGFQIIEHNWRTRYCEIDLVASQNKVIYLVEVKYRRSNWQGSGVEQITAAKLQKMRFAAQMWVTKHAWLGDYRLMVCSVAGRPPTIKRCVLL